MAEQTGSGASLADFIWKNAEDLWGDFKHTDFGKIILPFTLLRRLECVLEPTRKDVRETHAAFKDAGIDIDLVLRQATRYPFYNTSEYALGNLGKRQDPPEPPRLYRPLLGQRSHHIRAVRFHEHRHSSR